MMRPHEGRSLIPGLLHEREIVDGVRRYLQAMSATGLLLAIFLLLSLLGVKGYTMAVHAVRLPGLDPDLLERHDLLLPDAIVEDYKVDVARLLRPVCDAAWQACGFPASLNYNEKGEWIAT